MLHYKAVEYENYINCKEKEICGYSVEKLVKQYGLPLHILFKDKFIANIQDYQNVFKMYYPNGQICYAMKSYCGLPVMKEIARLGCGADASSENELKTAIMAGIEPDRIMVNGNAKTDEVLTYCIEHGLNIVADSIYEFHQIEKLANKHKKKAKVLTRISGFQFSFSTDNCILTSGEWTKFGIPYNEFIDEILEHERNEYVELIGIHIHIGSQISSYQPYLLVLEKIFSLLDMMKEKNIQVKVLDIGGGFPISYVNEDDWNVFCKRIQEHTKEDKNKDSIVWGNRMDSYVINEDFYTKYPKSDMLEKILTSTVNYKGNKLLVTQLLAEFGTPKLVIEPGRSIAGDAGITISKVNGIKKVMDNNLLVLEMGAVNYAGSVIHNLYNIWDVLGGNSDEKDFSAYITGNLCYNGDMISRYKINFPKKPCRGDYVITYDTGATESHFFASNANMYPIPSRLFMDKQGNISLIKKREELNEITVLK